MSIEGVGSFIRTSRGGFISIMDLKDEDIDIEEIAHSLSNLCRWVGHTSEFYSVAQHSLYVAGQCKQENALWGLLHDASEAYLSDISRTLKHMAGMESYRDIEKKIMNKILKRFNLPIQDEFGECGMPDDVREADNRILQTEDRDLFPPPAIDRGIGDPYNFKITPFHPRVAKIVFMERFHQLYKGDNIGTEIIKRVS